MESAPVAPIDPVAALLVDAGSPAEAESWVREAARYGFEELWIEAADPETVGAAIARAGRPVRLAIRPWLALGDVSDPDRNVLGDRARDVAPRFESGPPFAPRGRDLFAPGRSDEAARWSAFARAARVPGLAGAILLDAQPEGYAGETRLPTLNVSLRRFGYAETNRLAFLRATAFDPIDLVPRLPGRPWDLSPPFFSVSKLAGAGDRWAEWLAAANRKGVASLTSALGGLPLAVQAAPDSNFAGSGPVGERAILAVPEAMDAATLRSRLAARRRNGRPGPYALDLSDVPPARRAHFLADVFRPARNP